MKTAIIDQLLSKDEQILTKSIKCPWALLIDLLFNRLAPGFILIPLLFFSVLYPEKMYNTIKDEEGWLISICVFLLILGIIGQFVELFDYFTVRLMVTSKRIYLTEWKKTTVIDYADIHSVEIDRGVVSSTMDIILFNKDRYEIEYLDNRNSEELKSIIIDTRIRTQVP